MSILLQNDHYSLSFIINQQYNFLLKKYFKFKLNYYYYFIIYATMYIDQFHFIKLLPFFLIFHSYFLFNLYLAPL
jgi:hypothetical protein